MNLPNKALGQFSVMVGEDAKTVKFNAKIVGTPIGMTRTRLGEALDIDSFARGSALTSSTDTWKGNSTMNGLGRMKTMTNRLRAPEGVRKAR